MNETMLSGRVVVVTGAGGGIGREVALAMAREGAKVVVNDVGASIAGEGLDAGPAARVADEIRAAGGEAAVSTDSVASWESAHRIIECALDSFGRIDAVVNNAGILRDRMFHKMSAAEWESVIGVHLMGSFYVARAAAPHFREQGHGAYVHMTSNAGLIGAVGQANYSAAKLGIVGLSKSISLEMARYGVRSNCISPAAWSRMIGSIPQDTPEQQQMVERMKSGLHASKIAPLAVYLASPEATEVNGQIFYVRGNEIFLYSQPRPVRSIHREGWTPATIASHAIPALKANFTPPQSIGDVFSWEPV